jgi:hypothetical protein
MRTTFIIALIGLTQTLFAVTVNLTNHTVYVKTPVTADEAASKGYVDSLPGSTYTFGTTNAALSLYTNGTEVLLGTDIGAVSDDVTWRDRTNDWNSVTQKVDTEALGGYLPTNTVLGISATESTNISLAVIAPYTNHQDRTDNPHGVTAAQAGALPTNTTLLTSANVTNDLDLAVSPSLTQTVALAAGALQPVITTGTPIGDSGISAFVIDAVKGNSGFPAISFVGDSGGSEFYSNSLALLSDGFHRLRGTAQPVEYDYKIYDEGNFTPAAIVAAGGALLSPVVSSNLLALVVNQTCSVPYRADAPATDQQFHMAQTQDVTLAMGAFSTNSAWSLPLSWNTMGYQLTYCACSFRTNIGTLRTNDVNLLIASRPAGVTNWAVTVIP